MATVRNLRKTIHSQDVGYEVVFNKFCKEGKIINDKLLPDSIRKSSYKELFTACVDLLFFANTNSTQFATKLVEIFGDYTTLHVENQNELKIFLGKLCEACGDACEHFISTERIDKCPNCDEDTDVEEVDSQPTPKKKKATTQKDRKSLRNSLGTSPRKSLGQKKKGFPIFFNKKCDVGKTVNEHKLPNSIREGQLTDVFRACVDALQIANIDSEKFTGTLGKAIGDYTKIKIDSLDDLKFLLGKLCAACGSCENFISTEMVENCPVCDSDEDEADEAENHEPVPNKKKTAASKLKVAVTLNTTQPRVSLVRNDFSGMAERTEVRLPPQSPSDGGINDSVASNSGVNEVHAPAHAKEITLKRASATLISIDRSNKRPSGASITSSVGGWSLRNSPTAKMPRMLSGQTEVNVERLNEEIQVLESASAHGPTLEEVTEDDTEDRAERSVVDDEMESHDLTSDDNANANHDASMEMAETDSRVYDTQDETAMSDVESTDAEEEWSPEKVAAFIIAEDADLEEFAKFIRNERIGGQLLPYLSAITLTDYVPSPIGDHCRFLYAIDKLKKAMRSQVKHLAAEQTAAEAE